MKTILIIGGTSAIALAAVSVWLNRQATQIVLLGRDQERLIRVQNDLRLRHQNSRIEMDSFDISSTERIVAEAGSILQRFSPDVILIAHGWLAPQKESQENLALAADALNINGVSAVLWMEACSQYLESKGEGSLAIIGSVAGDRGRQSNYIYGASKALVASYAEGLQHRFANSKINITLIKPGPTESPMTEHLKASGMKLAKVETVGKDIVKAIDLGLPVVYSPKVWRWIMLVVRHLPQFIMHKTKL